MNRRLRAGSGVISHLGVVECEINSRLDEKMNALLVLLLASFVIMPEVQLRPAHASAFAVLAGR